MELSGDYLFDAPQSLVWDSLLDPNVLGQVMPGGKIVQDSSPDVAVTLGRGPDLDTAAAVKIRWFYQHLKVTRRNDPCQDSSPGRIPVPGSLKLKLQVFHMQFLLR